jgi:hypothetical protein
MKDDGVVGQGERLLGNERLWLYILDGPQLGQGVAAGEIKVAFRFQCNRKFLSNELDRSRALSYEIGRAEIFKLVPFDPDRWPVNSAAVCSNSNGQGFGFSFPCKAPIS